MPKTAVVLLSGGIDSTTCLYLAKRDGFRPVCLIFDYGQRHRREIESAKKIARRSLSAYLVCKINLPGKDCSLINSKLNIPRHGRGIPSTYVSARNIIFLSFALSYAEAIGAKAIFFGANTRDFSGYPDCRANFLGAFRKVAKTGLKNKDIRILTPLLDKTKAQIIKLGQSLEAPYHLSWSCYRGRVEPCGICDSCRFRAKGFRQAGVKDPLITKGFVPLTGKALKTG